jgi:hypothetical protein
MAEKPAIGQSVAPPAEKPLAAKPPGRVTATPLADTYQGQ